MVSAKKDDLKMAAEHALLAVEIDRRRVKANPADARAKRTWPATLRHLWRGSPA
jgi:hypothetical protein